MTIRRRSLPVPSGLLPLEKVAVQVVPAAQVIQKFWLPAVVNVPTTPEFTEILPNTIIGTRPMLHAAPPTRMVTGMFR